MDAQELRNLQEAYMEVYHELDEGYKPLPAGRMARRIAGTSHKSITSYVNPMVRGGETPHTTGGQIATQKSDKLAKRAGQMSDVLLQHKPERSKAIAVANRATGEVAKKDPGAAKVLRKYAKKRRGSLPGPGRRDTIGEQTDIYDIILSHLLDEGYAETPEAAEAIMVNMSEEWRESICEGMTMKDFKANRKKNERRAASADAEKRGHEGKEWYNTGRKYSPDEAKSRRSNMSDYERQKRYQTSEDPDSDNADNYPASKTKNPKKLRKQKAMGEHG